MLHIFDFLAFLCGKKIEIHSISTQSLDIYRIKVNIEKHHGYVLLYIGVRTNDFCMRHSRLRSLDCVTRVQTYTEKLNVVVRIRISR
jgi:hypothetical protein